MLSTEDSAEVPRLALIGEPLFDRRGWHRSPVTLPSYRLGREPANKGRKFPAEVLTADEVYALMDACGRGPAGIRNRALIAVLWRSGLRVGEALALERKDVDLRAGRITILHGKGDKRRVVAIDPGAAAILECWERERANLGLDGHDAYFCVIAEPTKGMPIGGAYVRDLFKKIGVKACIEKRVHPHGLRHSFAAHIGESLQAHYVQRMLGHTSLAVTVRYLDHLSPSQAIEAVQAVPWPERGAAQAPATR